MPPRSDVKPVDYAPSVLTVRGRVLHFAVWARPWSGWPGPLCRSKGDWEAAAFGTTMDFPEVPICKRCINEVRLFTFAIKGRA